MPLPGYEWVNNAKNGGSPYATPDYYPYPPSILLHMTVSMGISASYISGHAYPPHCWANPYDGRLYQTVELDRAAYALYQPSYGYHWVNKKAFCLQTECVGVPVVSTPTWSDAHLRWLAEHVVVPQERWLRDRGMTANIGNFRYHTNTSGSASEDWGGRMGEQEWADFNGLYCHIDAWGNDHWDCSAERIDLISHYALEILGGGGGPPPKPTYPLTGLAMFILQEKVRGAWLMGAGYSQHLDPEQYSQVTGIPGIGTFNCGDNARAFDVLWAACMNGTEASES